MSKSTLKTGFSVRIENQAKNYEDWSGILDVLSFQAGVNSFQSE